MLSLPELAWGERAGEAKGSVPFTWPWCIDVIGVHLARCHSQKHDYSTGLLRWSVDLNLGMNVA